jgi:hypothetical protein
VALLAKVLGTLEAVLQRSSARIVKNASCTGCSQGGVLVAYLGLQGTPDNAALHLIRVARQLNELNDPRVSHSIFDVMLNLLIGLHLVVEETVSGVVPEYPQDGIEDERTTPSENLTPPRIYEALLGNAVSTACAMQGLAEPGDIIASSTFYDHVKGRYIGEELTSELHLSRSPSRESPQCNETKLPFS